MTSYERTRNMSVEELARKLVYWDDSYGVYRTDNCNEFDEKSDAIKDEIEWLLQEAE